MIKIIKESKQSITDFSKREIQEFFNSIPFEEFVGNLKKVLENNNLEIGEITLGVKGKIMYISENFADNCGVISPLFKDVVIHDWDSKIDVDKETGELCCYMNPHFSFEVVDGVSNAIEIPGASGMYNKVDGWIFYR